LTRWGRASRYAGSGDRAAVADLVYDALRRKRSRAWRMGEESGRALIVAGAADARDLFTGEAHAPEPLDSAEQAALDMDRADPPPAVALDFPDWLEPELRRSLDDNLAPVMMAMRDRAPVDLRVNRLKSDPVAAAAALAGDGVETAPGPLTPNCLRVTGGARKLRGGAACAAGLVEVQDAASQAVADFADARPGETILDYCAGGGGKALALAAAAPGARICAHDAAPERMKDIPPRARRAGTEIEICATLPAELRGACDLVFVDAPCSGSGAWRRNPDAKWSLIPSRLEELVALQRRILTDAAAYLHPGGRLIYATCSLFRAENEDQVGWFLAEHGEWTLEAETRFSPFDGGDGFYVARFRIRQ
ncbi:RsmB/NOP family class I SAM-dependent RNA methyltransferase, partial [bacterium]|nr:RsmB/NOP family class I SAM-dependent RNA methyltransferase [bacterium]